MNCRWGLGLLVTGMSVACAESTLSRDSVTESISALDAFRREAHFRIQTGVPLQSAFSCYSVAEVERTPLNRFVLERGWVRFESREAVIGFGTKASCPAIALTQAGEVASQQWARNASASSQGTVWAVPIGRRELLGVTELATRPDGSSHAEFDWKWTPNETGNALRNSVAHATPFFDQIRKGRASCQQQDGGWRCQLGMWTTPADVGELPPAS